MDVLVDTSVWIDYFRSGQNSEDMDALIDENLLCTNDVILAELLPFLKTRKQYKVAKLLDEIHRVPLNIDWAEIVEYQVKCLKIGANGIGIPDLMIAQNAKQHSLKVYSLDKHFRLLNQAIKVKLYH